MNPTLTRDAAPIKPVTLADVAKAAGISKTTASHALSGKGRVSPETCQSVMRLAQEMGFEADPLAQLLTNKRNEKMIGIFTLDIDLSQRTRLLQLIQEELSDAGFMVPTYAYGYHGREEFEAQREMMKTLISQRPRAIVCNMTAIHTRVYEMLERYRAGGGVLVCYGYDNFMPLDCDQIIYPEGELFGDAARHLLELGHREIGLFSVGHRVPSGRVLECFAKVMAEFGAPIQEEWLFGNDGTLRYEAVGHRLAQTFLALEKRPSAMIVSNDYAAASFVSTLCKAGVRVPEDVSVMGYGNDAIAEYARVPLSTVCVPIDSTARRVVQILQERLNGLTHASHYERVEGELIIRESTSGLVR